MNNMTTMEAFQNSDTYHKLVAAYPSFEQYVYIQFLQSRNISWYFYYLVIFIGFYKWNVLLICQEMLLVVRVHMYYLGKCHFITSAVWNIYCTTAFSEHFTSFCDSLIQLDIDQHTYLCLVCYRLLIDLPSPALSTKWVDKLLLVTLPFAWSAIKPPERAHIANDSTPSALMNALANGALTADLLILALMLHESNELPKPSLLPYLPTVLRAICLRLDFLIINQSLFSLPWMERNNLSAWICFQDRRRQIIFKRLLLLKWNLPLSCSRPRNYPLMRMVILPLLSRSKKKCAFRRQRMPSYLEWKNCLEMYGTTWMQNYEKKNPPLYPFCRYVHMKACTYIKS